MTDFRSILHSACAEVGIAAADKQAALVAAVEALGRSGKIADKVRLLDEIDARERMASTGIGFGVAVPHTLSDHLSETLLGLIRLVKPVPFEAADGEAVDLIFIMAGPRNDTANHLKVLSKLARLLLDSDFRASLRGAPDAETLVQLLYSRD